MEEALQHETTTQCLGLPPTGTGNHRPDGPKAGDALTLELDHSGGADHYNAPKNATVPFGLIACDDTDPNQRFSYDDTSMQIQLAADPAQCVTVSATIDDAGPYQSRDLILAACKELDPSFKQWVIQE